MKLKPLKEMLKISGDKAKELLAPVRARKYRKKLELKIVENEEKQATLEAEMNEICTSDDISIDRLIEKRNKYDLLEREKKILTEFSDQLFPA